MAEVKVNQAKVHDLESGWHVDQAILYDQERVVVILFGNPNEVDVMVQTEMLRKIAPDVVNFATLYTCDISKVKDFNKSALLPLRSDADYVPFTDPDKCTNSMIHVRSCSFGATSMS